jgi:2-methylcitrate dehydratase PrpD
MEKTKQFVNWILDASINDFDEATLNYTKALLLKTIAGMVAGADEPIGKNLINYLSSIGGSRDATIIGGGFKSTVENAALALGTFAHASELEDDRFPGPIGDYWVFPAFFPLGEWLGSSGKEIIEATIVSWEADWRMAKTGPSWLMVEKGIVTNAWFGVVAVAAGAARLLKLTPEQTINAMSLAASQASGLGCQLGWDAHFLESGNSCRAGVLSAFLAKAGATGRPDFLEVPAGLYAPIWDLGKVNTDYLIEGLGKPPYDINNVWIKKYPSCYGTHMSLDALMLLMKEHGVKYDDVETVETEVDCYVGQLVNRPFPNSLGEARFSLQYTLGEFLLRGTIGLDSFTDESKLSDPILREAQSKVKVTIPEGWGDPTRGLLSSDTFSYGAGINLHLKDGRQLKKHLKVPIGHPSEPLSYEKVREICRPFIDDFIGKRKGDKVAEITLKMEKLPDIREMMNLLSAFERKR